MGPLYRAQPLDHLRPPAGEQTRDLPPFKNNAPIIDGRQVLPSMDPISRPSSTSTQSSMLHHSTSLPQLPGLSALASLASGRNSPQLRGFSAGPNNGVNYAISSPSATSGGGSPPTCQNCQTSTTPLWRRDESGSVLCNACGLFLKLHGRPRPISLKTDVIKSRNRVKNPQGPGHSQKKKTQFDSNGLGEARSQAGTPPPGAMSQRRASHNAHMPLSDGSNSPISRTATPSMYGSHHQTFEGSGLVDHQYHMATSLPSGHLRLNSPGRSESSVNGDRHLDVPQTYEALIAINSSLKTRVSELEVINELFRGRVTQLEQDEANARRGEEMRRLSELSLRQNLEESQRRENQLKRRLDDLEHDLSEQREASGRAAKKMRVADMVVESESSTPASTN